MVDRYLNKDSGVIPSKISKHFRRSCEGKSAWTAWTAWTVLDVEENN